MMSLLISLTRDALQTWTLGLREFSAIGYLAGRISLCIGVIPQARPMVHARSGSSLVLGQPSGL